METIHYGIIGSGSHALQSHAAPAQKLDGFTLASLCDVSETSMQNFTGAYGEELETFTDRRQFLADSAISAVLIATPDEAHYDDMTAALDAGKHTFVEKPVAVTVAEVSQLKDELETASSAGLVVSSCHPRRFDPPFTWLKDSLPGLQEELGNPVHFSFDFSYHKPSRQWKHDRGLLLDHANHEIDLLNFYFGRSGFDAHRLADSYDHYRVAGVRDDGITFDFGGTRRLNAHTYEEWAKVRFDMGEIALSAHDGTATITNHDTSTSTEVNAPPTDYAARGLATMENFRDAIRGTAENYLDPEDIFVNTATSVMLSHQPHWRYDNENH